MDIQILPPEVVNQIAAGEVVERPSFLVKELLENSIDAGATSVEVEADQGGRRILVRDNGSGIAHGELSLALARHGTSKIKASSDLWSLHSFGFRGEALASVSAVSRLSLTSRKKGHLMAHRLCSEFGKESPAEEIGGDIGTTILVEELFSNVPARLKFLKSDAAEINQIKNTLRAMALSHPAIQIKFKHKGELVFYWPARPDIKARVEQVLGQKKMYQGEGVCDTITAKVVISSPNNTVKSSRQIWILVQNRWVQDKTLHAAVMDAYRNLLMHREFPYVALCLNVATEDIDVNIHPTKSQVKFRDASAAYKAVHRAVRGVLEKAPWLEDLLGDGPAVSGSPNGNRDETTKSEVIIPEAGSADESRVILTSQVTKPFNDKVFDRVQFKVKHEVANGTTLGVQEPSEKYVNQASSFVIAEPLKVEQKAKLPAFKNTQVDQSDSSVLKNSNDLSLGRLKLDQLSSGSASKANPLQSETHAEPSWGNLQIIGQADLTYIICQNQKTIIYIDQHASHERILFEGLLQQWDQNEKVESQGLLLPLNLELAADHVRALLSHREYFAKIGILIESDGSTALKINSLPVLAKESSIIETLTRFALELVENGGSVSFENYVADIFASMACHSAIRAGQVLCTDEMEHLLQQMDDYALSSFCPHGRPVFVEYPLAQLEKAFGRIV